MHLSLEREALNLHMDYDEDWPIKPVTYISFKALALRDFYVLQHRIEIMNNSTSITLGLYNQQY